MSYGEYLDLERLSEEKHEFVDGMAVAMAGGSIERCLVEAQSVAIRVAHRVGRLAGRRQLREYESVIVSSITTIDAVVSAEAAPGTVPTVSERQLPTASIVSAQREARTTRPTQPNLFRTEPPMSASERPTREQGLRHPQEEMRGGGKVPLRLNEASTQRRRRRRRRARRRR